MAIQADNTFTYNYSSYNQPYFRLVLHLPLSGAETPVDVGMYVSYEDYTASMQPTSDYTGPGALNNIPVYIPTQNAPASATGATVVDQYLYWVTQQVVTKLQEISPSTTFTITGIPS